METNASTPSKWSSKTKAVTGKSIDDNEIIIEQKECNRSEMSAIIGPRGATVNMIMAKSGAIIITPLKEKVPKK